MECQWKFFIRGISSWSMFLSSFYLYTQFVALHEFSNPTARCCERILWITKAFKLCGQFNDVHGRENHLVKIQGLPEYKPPAKSDPWLIDPLSEGKKKRKKKTQPKRKAKKRKKSQSKRKAKKPKKS